MSEHIWERVLARVEAKLNRHTFMTWFKPTRFIREDGDTLIVEVPDGTVRDWLLRHYGSILAEAVAEAGRPGVVVSFVPADGSLPVEPSRAEDLLIRQPDDAGTATAPSHGSSGLNHRYTFDTFVVGPSNQFANAAARAVAEAPGRSYNPLFMYGGVGLGKTHLMHAIGQYVDRHHRQAALTYISSERFMNEMINAIRYERIIDFRERYRNVDVLLVDDAQFLAGKEATQNEFFHTFNALYDAGKQIVISSDRPPHEIPALEERLRSRFNWGLIADIQPPDLETKVAILKKKADADGVPLPDNVALFIATKIKSNIRDLEGSLIRLVAYASLTGKDITLALAQDVLRSIIGSEEKAVTIDTILKFVADFYGVRPSELKTASNSRTIVIPRQVAMYLCKTLTSASLPDIGRAFGKHHSTVLHSIRKVEDDRGKDGDFNSQINAMLDNFR
ncbi:chromosomal replication initiator protein DnaA [Luteitalea sp.]|jgi:chromosomal replication initiator protein|uniref:chromosomal replication initiator protein DnaA n=1 Tax=Luteitalea sp. TaxID=2004800 RepID=UPI0037CB4CF5